MGKTSFDDLLRVASTGKELRRQWWIVDPRDVAWWDAATSLALLFTALVTPFEVSYLPPPESADEALFVINRLVDLVFIADVVLHFFLMRRKEVSLEMIAEAAGRDGAEDKLDPEWETREGRSSSETP